MPSTPDSARSGQRRIVAYVSPAWPPQNVANGVVTYIEQLGDSLRRMGHEVWVVSSDVAADCDDPYLVVPEPPSRSLRWWDRCIAAAAYRISPQRWIRRNAGRSIQIAVEQLVRRQGVELVEMEEAFGRARQLIPRCGAPVVVRLHGPWFLSGAAKGVVEDQAFAQRVRDEGEALRDAAGVTAPSLDVLNRVRRKYRLELPNAAVIPNAIAPVDPADRWSVRNCDRDTILYVGRFDRLKGADVAVGAFAQLAKSRPNCRLVLVGPDDGVIDDDGELRHAPQYVAQHVSDEAVRRRIEWKGLLGPRRIADLRRKAHVTIVPSRYESFSMTTVEAMAGGCPTVSAKVGGMAEIVEHQRNGMLFEAADSGDLAVQIARILDDDGLAARLGRQAAMDCAERYHPDQVARQTLDYYHRIIAQFRRSGELKGQAAS